MLAHRCQTTMTLCLHRSSGVHWRFSWARMLCHTSTVTFLSQSFQFPPKQVEASSKWKRNPCGWRCVSSTSFWWLFWDLSCYANRHLQPGMKHCLFVSLRLNHSAWLSRCFILKGPMRTGRFKSWVLLRYPNWPRFTLLKLKDLLNFFHKFANKQHKHLCSNICYHL